MSRAKNHSEIHENPKNEKLGFGSHKVGISGGHIKVRGAENGFKNCRRKFCKDCENFKSIGTGVEKSLKISF